MRATCVAVLIEILCAGSFARAQTVSVYVGSSINAFDPHHSVTFAEHVVAGAMHRGLVEYDIDGRLAPGLAESWSIDRSGTRYVLTLRPSLTWSDGSPLIAADVVAGVERALDPARPSPFAARLWGIVNARQYMSASLSDGEKLGVEALDARTVAFTLQKPDYTFLSTLTWPVTFPAPRSRPDLVADGLMTTGDYTVSPDHTDLLTLKARKGDFRLAFSIKDSADTAWASSSAESHFVSAALPIATVPSVGERGDQIRPNGGDALYAYVVNTSRPPLNTLETRHALAMAINRTAVLSRVSIRNAVPALEFVPPRAKTYQTSYKTPYAALSEEEREAVAEALLAEVGYGRNNRFSVRLRIPAGDVHRRVAEAVADQWARSGIATDIVEAPMAEHWRQVAAGDFDAAFAIWPGPRNTPRTFLEPLSVLGGPWNFGRYSFEGLDERLSRASEHEESDGQGRFYREAEKALIEDQSIFALFYYRPLALVSSSVSGWRSNPAGVHPLRLVSADPLRQSPQILRPELPRPVPSLGQGK